MNKSDVTIVLGRELNLPPRKAEDVVDAVFDTMFKALVSNDRIEIRGFGSFAVKQYDEYTGWNPKTGEEIAIPSKRLPLFKVGKDFRERVNQE